MERGMRDDHVFHRDLSKKYPLITHGKGSYLYSEEGTRYLDACSGAVAANLGHGIEEIASAMANQAKRAAFVHTLRFETPVLYKLSEKIARFAPDGLNKVYFTSGGSEANESAIKLARQFHRDAGKPEKHVVIGRWQSYHGNTFGSLSAGGDIKRRQVYTPNLLHFTHIHSPNCLRCPFQRDKGDCDSRQDWSCSTSLEQLILEVGPQNVSAFIAEPITGSQLGSVVPPDNYFKEVRRICDQYDVLLIADEVMTGFGRTGKTFAIEYFDVIPDIITFGKGISAGYAPLAGMIVHDRLIKGLIQNSKGKFVHGYTYSGHPVSVAAGLAVLDIYEREKILENVVEKGNYLLQKLIELKREIPLIFDVRGKGLLLGLEFAADAEGTPFKQDLQITERINEKAIELGAVFYPGSGTINGYLGDHLIVSPPLNSKTNEIDELVHILRKSIKLTIEEIREAGFYDSAK
ncbi:adenosylmethionine-8-amino-7-oxononanoate aminotransferase [Peribacillus deserti]|uniref:Adenosylmethionine-8-amino-7-oxononanoate aminotransferase n=1 Tax=Peribacillus deserti TaxID=673318 RepID=A0ABS2QDF5_9BACI|nr:aspartate aminotransferase family protein [Peribacillus deserti]MBM7691190.1 adenosylmethionine-8-amino-7-oxononanoate aminotransferase [Peribacillus deserti]